MRLEAGQKAININLPSIDGSIFELDEVKGKKVLLTFFRFAGCPFCNLRVHELVKRHAELAKDFVVVAVFDSPLDNLQDHAEGHHAPFPILADESNRYYREYGIERSIAGILKTLLIRIPEMLTGLSKGYIPLKFKGHITTMPADFLIDREGIIQVAHYGSDAADHLPFETVSAFSKE